MVNVVNNISAGLSALYYYYLRKKKLDFIGFPDHELVQYIIDSMRVSTSCILAVKIMALIILDNRDPSMNMINDNLKSI